MVLLCPEPNYQHGCVKLLFLDTLPTWMFQYKH